MISVVFGGACSRLVAAYRWSIVGQGGETHPAYDPILPNRAGYSG
jgi:hypothetical protein